MSILFALLLAVIVYFVVLRFFEVGFVDMINQLPEQSNISYDNSDSFSKIPKVLYICNKNVDSIPPEIVSQWQNLNPNYEIKLFGNTECTQYLSDTYSDQFATNFALIPDGPIKADFWRACILFERGGVYADVDIVPIASIDEILYGNDMTDNPTFVIPGAGVFWKTVNPCFIATTPKNPILKDVLNLYDYLFTNVQYSYWQFSIVLVLTKVLQGYFDVTNIATTYIHRNQTIKILKETYTNLATLPVMCNKSGCSNDFILNDKQERVLKTRADNYDRFKHAFVSLMRFRPR